MNIILIAPPAAGKGTISNMLTSKYKFSHISAGSVLRNVIESKSELGNSIKKTVESGNLVDDTLLKNLLTEELKNYDLSKPLLFDGYPRKLNQVYDYIEIVNTLGIEEGKAIYLYLNEEIAKKRALGRLNCRNCGSIYNKYFDSLAPVEKGICDNCHHALQTRKDDNEESFKRRYNNFLKETTTVIEYFKRNNNLLVVDASLTPEEILKEIVEYLGESS